MDVLWGILMAAIGIVLASWASTESNAAVYRLLAARSRILWGDLVHRFYQVVGVVLAVLGILWATGVIW